VIKIKEGNQVVAFIPCRVEPGIDVAALLPGLEALEVSTRRRLVVALDALAGEVQDVNAAMLVLLVEMADQHAHARIVFLVEHPMVDSVAACVDVHHAFQLVSQQVEFATWHEGGRHRNAQAGRHCRIEENRPLHGEHSIYISQLPEGHEGAIDGEDRPDSGPRDELRKQEGQDLCGEPEQCGQKDHLHCDEHGSLTPGGNGLESIRQGPGAHSRVFLAPQDRLRRRSHRYASRVGLGARVGGNDGILGTC